MTFYKMWKGWCVVVKNVKQTYIFSIGLWIFLQQAIRGGSKMGWQQDGSSQVSAGSVKSRQGECEFCSFDEDGSACRCHAWAHLWPRWRWRLPQGWQFHAFSKFCYHLFLGPRGPLGTPLSVRSSVRSSVCPRQKSKSHLKPYKSSQAHARPLRWTIGVKRTMSSIIMW